MLNKFRAMNINIEYEESYVIRTQTDIDVHSEHYFNLALEHIKKVIKTQSKLGFSRTILTIQLEEEDTYKKHDIKRYVIEFFEGCFIEHRPYDELERSYPAKTKEQYSSTTKLLNELFKELKIIFEINVNYK